MTISAMSRESAQQRACATRTNDLYARIGVFGGTPEGEGATFVTGICANSTLRVVSKVEAKPAGLEASAGVPQCADVVTTLLPDRSFGFVDAAASRGVATWGERLSQALIAAAHIGAEDPSRVRIIMVGSDCFETEIRKDEVFARVDLRRIARHANAESIVPEQESQCAATRGMYEVNALPVLLLPEAGSIVALDVDEPGRDALASVRGKQSREGGVRDWRRTLLLTRASRSEPYRLIEMSNEQSREIAECALLEACCVADLFFQAMPNSIDLTIEVSGAFAAGWSRLRFKRDTNRRVNSILLGGRFNISAPAQITKGVGSPP
jgi:hypothetical protein